MKNNIKIIILCLSLIFASSVLADCYVIKDSDGKNYCLAKSKNKISYCYVINNSDMKHNCLAQLKSQQLTLSTATILIAKAMISLQKRAQMSVYKSPTLKFTLTQMERFRAITIWTSRSALGTRNTLSPRTMGRPKTFYGVVRQMIIMIKR
jgi:hypothetical protein